MVRLEVFDVTLPNVELFGSVAGSEKFGWFSQLYISARNWIAWCSVTAKALNRAMFQLWLPGL